MGDIESRLREMESRMKEIQYLIAMLDDRVKQALMFMNQTSGPQT